MDVRNPAGSDFLSAVASIAIKDSSPPWNPVMKTATGITRVHNGQLIDGTGAAPVPDAVVIVTDGYITYAGPSADAPPTPGAQVVDARGGTIMPGLI